MEGSEKKDPLRDAIERTFAATAETRGRASDLLDEVSRRGQEAREVVAERGKEAREAIGKQAQEAGEASAGVAQRVVEAIEGLRLATHDEVRELEEQISELAKRVADLESKGQAKPKVEG
jgi:polyhydroxyalkanoate synthesis regulator phasin